jgi:hypothetical protein
MEGVTRLMFLVPFGAGSLPTLRRTKSDPSLPTTNDNASENENENENASEHASENENENEEESDVAPPRRVEQERGDPVERPSTLGAESFSPTGWTKKLSIYNATINSGFLTAKFPELTLSFIFYDGGSYTAYLMVQWWPEPSGVFRRPDSIHTSLVRCRPVGPRPSTAASESDPNPGAHWPGSSELLRAFWEEGFGDSLQAIFASALEALKVQNPRYRGPGPRQTRILLALPEWPRSWCFGISQDLVAILRLIGLAFETWVLLRFPGIRLLERRGMHISWE